MLLGADTLELRLLKPQLGEHLVENTVVLGAPAALVDGPGVGASIGWNRTDLKIWCLAAGLEPVASSPLRTLSPPLLTDASHRLY